MKSDTKLEPGNIVPKSGIYVVTHEGAHHEVHEVTCVKGKRFPPCNTCGDAVEFRLVRSAKYIKKHDQFRKPKATAS